MGSEAGGEPREADTPDVVRAEGLNSERGSGLQPLLLFHEVAKMPPTLLSKGDSLEEQEPVESFANAFEVVPALVLDPGIAAQ